MMRALHWLIAVLMVTAVPTEASDPGSRLLPMVGADEHIWFMLPSETSIGQWDLCHLGRGSGEVSYRVVRRLPQRPAAMAAWSNTLWLVMESPHAAEATWDVYRLRAEYQESLELNFMIPRDGFGTLPPLTGVDAVHGMAGTSTGPLVFADRDSARIATRMVSGRWADVDLPESEASADGSRMLGCGCCGPGGIAIAVEQEGLVTIWTRGLSGDWFRAGDSIQGEAIELINLDSHPLLVSSGDDEVLVLDYVQGSLRTRLTTIEEPATEWGMAGLTGGAVLLTVDGRQVDAVQIDALSGVRRTIELVQPQGLIASSIWSIAVAVGLACMVIMVIVLARGGDLANAVLPEGCAPMQPFVRLLALCIDLVPGLMVFFLLLDGSLRDLVRVPMLSLSADEVSSYAWLVLVTIVWCALWESWIGTSMGKGLCGGRVQSITGPLKARQVLVRNFVKGLILLVPPLAVLTLLHPNQQGLGDLLARTVVVRPIAPLPSE